MIGTWEEAARPLLAATSCGALEIGSDPQIGSVLEPNSGAPPLRLSSCCRLDSLGGGAGMVVVPEEACLSLEALLLPES